MKNLMRTISLAFAAGVAGALVNSVAAWAAGRYGITAALRVRLAPELTLAYLYPRLVWGGIWGLLLVLPLGGMRVWTRGLLISLAPSLVQLLVIFPYRTPNGPLGLGLGTLTPVVVLVLNAIWGITAAYWAQKSS